MVNASTNGLAAHRQSQEINFTREMPGHLVNRSAPIIKLGDFLCSMHDLRHERGDRCRIVGHNYAAQHSRSQKTRTAYLVSAERLARATDELGVGSLGSACALQSSHRLRKTSLGDWSAAKFAHECRRQVEELELTNIIVSQT